jgi:3-methyladenine DNA glycosylase AlkD
MSRVIEIKKDMLKLANPKQAANLQRFFKTGPGEYGEGDIFLGIKVPEQRKIAKKYKDLSLEDLQELLNSKIHEHRLTSLFILVNKYKRSENKKEIFDFYIKNTKNINNWDLVDSSAPYIVGDYLLEKDKSLLYKLVKSDNIWERRIAVLGSGGFIKYKKFEDILKISELLLNDKHDLIHKAVGWMLREIGKRDQKVEEEFLKKRMKISKKKFSACQKSQSDFLAYYKIMPRTMLRYAIEKFKEEKRKFYLGK